MGHGAGKRDAEGVRARDDYSDRVVRDKRYKVWVDTDRSISALYDLQHDPWEQSNLIRSDQPAHRRALARLSRIVRQLPDVDARPQYRPRQANILGSSGPVAASGPEAVRLTQCRRSSVFF